jgi:hypothetical protein
MARPGTGEGSAMNNLGLALGEVRRFAEAITAYQDAWRATGKPPTRTARHRNRQS